MYFCFRWLLVDFKREFPYEDIMRLWEVREGGRVGRRKGVREEGGREREGGGREGGRGKEIVAVCGAWY